MTRILTIARYACVGAALLVTEVGAREPRSVPVAKSTGKVESKLGTKLETKVESDVESNSTCSVQLRSGRWRTPGGNFFWIQCTGSELFWLGMNRASGERSQGTMWTQVGHGIVRGAKIELSWADVPYGSIRTEGRIELRIAADTVLQLVRDDGPCDSSRITWVSAK